MVRPRVERDADLARVARGLALPRPPDALGVAYDALDRIRADLELAEGTPFAVVSEVLDAPDAGGTIWIEADDGSAFNLDTIGSLLILPIGGTDPATVNAVSYCLTAIIPGSPAARVAVGQDEDLRELRRAILERLEAGGGAVLRVASLLGEAFTRAAARPPLDHPDGGIRSD